MLLLAGVAAWVVFGLYWEAASQSVAPASRSESRASRAVHVFLKNAALILELAPIRGLGRFLPAAPTTMGVGLAIEAAGLLFAIWARRHLGSNWSGEITIKVDHRLIRSGPYRRLRHRISSAASGAGALRSRSRNSDARARLQRNSIGMSASQSSWAGFGPACITPTAYDAGRTEFRNHVKFVQS